MASVPYSSTAPPFPSHSTAVISISLPVPDGRGSSPRTPPVRDPASNWAFVLCGDCRHFRWVDSSTSLLLLLCLSVCVSLNVAPTSCRLEKANEQATYDHRAFPSRLFHADERNKVLTSTADANREWSSGCYLCTVHGRDRRVCDKTPACNIDHRRRIIHVRVEERKGWSCRPSRLREKERERRRSTCGKMNVTKPFVDNDFNVKMCREHRYTWRWSCFSDALMAANSFLSLGPDNELTFCSLKTDVDHNWLIHFVVGLQYTDTL